MPFLTPAQTPTAVRCRRLRIPNEIGWLEVVNGALADLLKETNWEQIDGISPRLAVERATQMFLEYLADDCPEPEVPVRIVGAVFPVVTDTMPDGCLPCEGGTYAAADYPELYAVLNSVFKLNATQFRVPNLTTRFVLGADSFRPPGTVGGSANKVLSIANLPPHTHDVQLRNNATALGANFPAASSSSAGSLGTRPSNSTGNGQPFDVMPPFLALRYAIVARP